MDAPGKSLANFKIQDQDGLGTCASNSASLLLHSNIEGNPSLSYIQLATIFKRSELNAKREELTKSNSSVFDVYAKKLQGTPGVVNPNAAQEDNWRLGIDGANVCGVIEKAKDYQKTSPTEGICRSDSVNLEKISGSNDNGWKQKKSLLAISKYMNEFQQKFGDALVVKKNEEVRKKYQEFKLAFEAQIKNKEALYSEECKKINADMFAPILNKMSSGFLAHSYCFEPDGDRFQMCQLIKKIMIVSSLPGGALRADYNNELLNTLISSFSGNEISVTKDQVKTKVYEAIQKINGSKFSGYMISAMAEVMEEVTNEVAETAVTGINEVKASGFSKTCAEMKLMDYLVSDDFKKEAKNDVVLCNSLALIENVREVINSTALSGVADIKKVRDFLLGNANLNFDQAMIGLYAYDCSAADKVKVPQNLTCENRDIAAWSKADINQKIINELKSNRALTVSICAAILDKPKAQFAANECGSHSVGITGVQCQDGHLKYLLQNSWGKNSKAKNATIVTDPSGNGSYWFDEQSFFDSSITIQSVGRE